MTEDECAEVFQALSEHVSNAGLQWINEQVDEAVALGKLVVAPIKERGSARDATYEVVQSSPDLTVDVRGPRRKYIQQIQVYTGCECLTMLLDALEIAVAKCDDLETATLNLLSGDQTNITVEFVPERRNDRAFILERSEINRLAPLRVLLSDKVALLRKEINAS